MKANELRIGNWYDHNGVPMQVTPNTIEEVWTAERIWCNPIPLTEEWLLKFGFVKCFFEENGLRLPWYKLDKNDYLFDIDYEFSYTRDDGGYIKIQHVHTLQNLYFALTGEELNKQSND